MSALNVNEMFLRTSFFHKNILKKVGSYLTHSHWHLDVTFREDANHTADKDAAYNLNIIRKTAINTLKLVDVGVNRISLKYKRYMISMNFEKYFKILMAL